MKLRSFIDNFSATSLAIIVHVALLGILVLSLDWSNPGARPSSRVEPVKAVVVDESQVAEEIEQIKRREAKKRREEEKRTKVLERDAQKARERRREEEKRLSELQRRLAEEKRKNDDNARKQREEAAKALAEVKRQRAKELEELEKLKRAESDMEKRRRADLAALALLAAQHKALAEEKRKILEDKVQLPRLFMVWLTPAHFAPGDAEFDLLANVLTGGKNSRLYKRLVYDLQIAQNVSAFQASQKLVSAFYIIATARSGHTLGELEAVIQEEINKLKENPPTDRELQRAVNQQESGFLSRLERIGGFGGKADLLNSYYFATGNPDYFNEDLARFKAANVTDIQAIVQSYLRDDGRVVLSVVPQGKTELAATKMETN